MKRVRKLVLLMIAPALALFAVGICGLAYLFSDICRNDVLAEHRSPDGKTKLVVFERSCGATTGFSTQASLLSPEATLPGSGGNLFVADTDHGAAPSGPGGGPELRARWEGSKRLLLEHHVRARVFKAQRYLDGIEVRYEALP